MKFTLGGSGSSVSQVVKSRLEPIVLGLHVGDLQPTEPPLRSGNYWVGDRWARRVLDSPRQNSLNIANLIEWFIIKTRMKDASSAIRVIQLHSSYVTSFFSAFLLHKYSSKLD